MSLPLIYLHQLILPLLIPQYVSFYSSLPSSLVLYWSGQYWLRFECMTIFSAINNLTYNDLSCLCYDAYMLQPHASWIDSHTLSILEGKLKKEKFRRHFYQLLFCGNIDLVCHNVTAALVKRLAQPWVQNDQFWASHCSICNLPWQLLKSPQAKHSKSTFTWTHTLCDLEELICAVKQFVC